MPKPRPVQSPAGIADLLGRPMEGVARLVLHHERHEAFRPMVIVEICLAALLFVCLLPFLLLIVLVGRGGDFDFPTFGSRWFVRWHEIHLSVLGPGGQILAQVRTRPASQEEGDAIVAAVLAAARRQGVVVVEMIGRHDQGAAEPIEVWYGGRPLLSDPQGRPEAQAVELLRQAGYLIEPLPDALVLREPQPRQSRLQAVVFLALVAIPFAPIVLWRSGRQPYRDLLLDLEGKPPGHKVVLVRAESLQTRFERDGNRRDEVLVDGSDLLGIAFSPTLDYGREVTRRDATLRLVGGRRTATLRLSRAAETGRAVRDLLVAASIRLRAARPELGLLGPGPRPTRCPYCGGLYDMQPGSRCPFCAAPAGEVA